MARGTNLVKLLDLLRAEARISLNPAHNQQTRDNHVSLLQRTQEWLWEDFDWPHLRVERDISAQEGQRFYDVPDDITIDRIAEVWFRYGQRWTRLCPDISMAHYQQWDSDLDQRSWPVTNWRISENEMMEMWPIPAQDAEVDTLEGKIRVVGIRKLRPFVANEDRADLDDRLITLYAAAELLGAAGAKDAKLKLDLAGKHYAKLRGGMMPRRKFRMGGGDSASTKDLLRGPPRVHYRTA